MATLQNEEPSENGQVPITEIGGDSVEFIEVPVAMTAKIVQVQDDAPLVAKMEDQCQGPLVRKEPLPKKEPLTKRKSMGDWFLEKIGSPTPPINSNGFEKPAQKIVKTFPLLTSMEKPCPLFTGRQETIGKVHNLVTSPSENDAVSVTSPLKIAVLTGQGGIGKSQVVKKYIEEYRGYHRNVTWLNATTNESLVQNFILLAQHFEICPEIVNHFQNNSKISREEIQQVVAQVYRHFSLIKKGLFVYDGVRVGVNDLSQFLPSVSQDPQIFPLILITSRELELVDNLKEIENLNGAKIQTIRLEKLGPIECLDLFRKLIKIPNVTSRTIQNKFDLTCPINLSFMALGQTLGHHPLAICLAGAAMSEGIGPKLSPLWTPDDFTQAGEEIEKYAHNFRFEGHRWMNYQPSEENSRLALDQNYGETIASIWFQVLKPLTSDDLDPTQKLLNILAFLPSNEIFVELCYFIENKIKLTSKSFTELTDGEMFELFKKLEKLYILQIPTNFVPTFNRASLLNFSEIEINPLVQKVWRELLKEFNPSEYNLKLEQVLEWICDNIKFIQFNSFTNSILNLAQESEWSIKTLKLCLGLVLNVKFQGPDLNQLEWLKLIYNKLNTEPNLCDAGNEEYSNLLKMAIILNENDRFLHFNQNSFQLKISSDFLQDQVSFKNGAKFVTWVLEQLVQYKDNLLVQDIGMQIILRIFILNGLEMNQEHQQICTTWIGQYNEVMRSPQLKLAYNSDEVSINIFCIARKVYESEKLLGMAVNLIEARLREDMEEFNFWRFFILTIPKLIGWSPDIWKSFEGLTAEQLEKALTLRKILIESKGLYNLTERVKSLDFEDGNANKIFYARELFQIIQDAAFSEDSAKKMLETHEFVEFLIDFLKSKLNYLTKSYNDKILNSALAITAIVTLISMLASQNEISDDIEGHLITILKEELIVNFLNDLEINLTNCEFSEEFNKHMLIRRDTFLKILSDFLNCHENVGVKIEIKIFELVHRLKNALTVSKQQEKMKIEEEGSSKDTISEVPETCKIL